MKFYYSGDVDTYIKPKRDIKQRPEEILEDTTIMLVFSKDLLQRPDRLKRIRDKRQ